MDHNYAGKEGKEPKKKRRNTNNCCVPQCYQYAETGVSMHHFPKVEKKRKQWEVVLRMGKPASLGLRVCSKHFLPSDYHPDVESKSRHRLRINAVPSQNLPVRTHDVVVSSRRQQQSAARKERAERRKSKEASSGSTSLSREVDSSSERTENTEVEAEPQALAISKLLQFDRSVQVNLADFRQRRPHQDGTGLADTLSRLKAEEKCSQVNFLPLWTDEETHTFTLPSVLTSKEDLFTFTGIHSLDVLEAVVKCVEDLAVDAATNKKIMSVRDRVLLTMVKIKQNMPFTGLGVLFGVSDQTCANYFKYMCPMLSRVMQVMIPFPDQESIRRNLPLSFKRYKCTRIILDCFEIPIEKSKCLKCRILTYSQYKKDYTVKFNLGVTPSGIISELSPSYGGRASDKLIVNDSGILRKLDYQDGVMVDKGYRIEKECDEHLLVLIRPPFLKKQKQMSKEDSLRNADIARARVHVERVIQRMRQYEFVSGTIPWALAPYVEDVVTIVAGLTNIGPPIISIDKFM